MKLSQIYWQLVGKKPVVLLRGYNPLVAPILQISHNVESTR